MATLSTAAPPYPLDLQSPIVDCNSSSDTYTDSDDIATAPVNLPFGGSTPTTSTTNLKSQIPQSPSKSILKTSFQSSPRKSVVFDHTDPEVHHYPQEDSEMSSEQPTTIYRPSDASRTPWSEPETPPPPPHRSMTFDHLAQSTAPVADHRHSMDFHLEQLALAAKENSTNSIAELGRNLHQTSTPSAPQQVLNDSKFSYASPGSSQSSLQSLRDNNRHLPSSTSATAVKGANLPGGMKRLSQVIAEQMVPATHHDAAIFPSPTFSRDPSFSEIQDSMSSHGGEEYGTDDFDKSYMSTSQSIMHILNSASNVSLNKKIAEPAEPTVKVEEEEPVIKVEEEPIVIKQEVESPLKNEDDSFAFFSEPVKPIEKDVSMAREDSIKSELSHVGEVLFESVSDFGRQSLPRLVETGADSSQESVRFHMDSAWKLEDSHDGDQEDNYDFTNDITAMSHAAPKTEQPSSSPSFEDASDLFENPEDEEDHQTLDPASGNPSPIRTQFREPNVPRELVVEDRTEEPVDKEVDNSEGDVLANSSNIAPPGEITLPTVEMNYSSFDEITNKFNESSAEEFEASLSAENDPQGPLNNYLSIWHNQTHRHRAPAKAPARSVLDTSSQATPKSTRSTLAPPPPTAASAATVAAKKFTGVHVVSRRVVSASNPDFDVSNFLPELSDDSGLESHFGFLKQRQASRQSSAASRVPSHREMKSKTMPMSSTPSYSLEPPSVASQLSQAMSYSSQPRRSRFRVPTFEIERTNSLLSPKNMYNKDIFGDAPMAPPTIVGHGLKTLPSMDKDDVRRILSAKSGVSATDYTKIKLKGGPSASRTSVAEPKVVYDHLEKHASICESSYISMEEDEHDEAEDAAQPHIAQEIMKAPKALRSTDQFFHDYDLFQDARDFPEPDADIVQDMQKGFMYAEYPLEGSTVPVANYEETGNKVDNEKAQSKRQSTPEMEATPATVKTPSSPNKRGSPLKVIAKNGEPIRRRPAGPKDIQAASRQASETSQATAVDENAVVSKTEEAVTAEAEPVVEEPQLPDRGRLFFRVVGVKDIDLKDVKDRDAEFTITLDNGMHCIKTTPYKLNSSSCMIGKEFELTVLDQLQFIITLKMSYKKPRDKVVEVKERQKVKPKSKLSRFMGQKDVITTSKFITKPVEDPWKTKFATDGSFGRCYVDLEQFEEEVSGKAGNFNLTCFNEWETFQENGRTVKAKPYRIGDLEVRMLFVPRTDLHEALPSSMRSAYESVAVLQRELKNYCEGYMYQEGGDCEVMKRRWFKLEGTSLIAHSEFSHKTRAKINLSKVVNVKYVDKENLNRGNDFRNFTDAVLLENSFQVKFANGETIDFGAATEMEKMKWIELIELIVAKNKFRRQPWVKMMLEHKPDATYTEAIDTFTYCGKSNVHSAFPQQYQGQKVI